MMPDSEINKLADNMKACGFDERFPIIMYQSLILDGRNRWLAAEQAGVQPLTQDFVGTDEEAQQFVYTANEPRRHLTQEWIAKRAEERRQRVAEARSEGQSIRKIAEKEDVSIGQVQRDIKQTGATVSGDTVEGKDKKTRPAKNPKPMCEKCTRNKTFGRPNDKNCADCKEIRKPKKTEPAPTVRGGTVDEPDPNKDEPKDENGTPWVTQASLQAIKATAPLKEMGRQIAVMLRQLNDNEDLQLYTYSIDSAKTSLKAVKDLFGNYPSYVCPYCDGTLKTTVDGSAKGKPCEMCNKEGWVPRHVYRRSPKAQEAKT
jgi:hypothetical protein